MGKAGNHSVADGRRGEAYAAAYLESRGYEILRKNFKCPSGEIDIIARADPFLVFAEVKTRKENSLFDPVFAVTRAKKRRIVRSAMDYLAASPAGLQPRFDVIALVTAAGDPGRILSAEHYENAFDAEGCFE